MHLNHYDFKAVKSEKVTDLNKQDLRLLTAETQGKNITP